MNSSKAVGLHAGKRFAALVAAISSMILVLSLPALAALGSDIASIQTDSAQMKGTWRIAEENTSYSIHEITLPGKTIVLEYISPEGKVFGVSWHGPFIPNMQQLLGAYFSQYSEAVKGENAKSAHRKPLNIQQPGLVVQTGGHMRSFYGKAFVPDLVPQDVKPEQIK